mmetsp:Transcript_43823/g.93184  ORF Transcript_43823/g.93184 Transcript_43823/m.93184 type:complete len:140 (-) Transcript_43823:76-495(-)|eukprot:CAMPEP_0172548912 /NCGR_PEP_ID=MMETSP1067-20121228/18109_1 /TAXON_ID=265564 ORGANISM="Thalassiosira punctigera, Strain Tpunct2005C2" /NCGR_SAMPLE_ID=MMETSP1067 /ASSEMBLY_ACC=CAM_ASM_000444 /LENGTH=139 /DNA_ID=CAMNT_0013336211 /DNA_START=78 /DNA_END=497 /DNA_ORIENTATION=+
MATFINASFDESISGDEEATEKHHFPPTASEDEADLEDEKGWDEGGRSDCGYSDGVHDALMSIGHVMHLLFGEPSESVRGHMAGCGNYFQEVSYAARDLRRGKVGKDAEDPYLYLEEEGGEEQVRSVVELSKIGQRSDE